MQLKTGKVKTCKPTMRKKNTNHVVQDAKNLHFKSAKPFRVK